MIEQVRLWNVRRRARKSMRNAPHDTAVVIMMALGDSHVPHTRAVAAVAAERAEDTAPTDAAAARYRRVRESLTAGYRVKIASYPALVRVGGDPLSLRTLAEIEDALDGATEEEGDDE